MGFSVPKPGSVTHTAHRRAIIGAVGQPEQQDRPQRPAWAYLDRAFPAGWNRATRLVEFRAALAPWNNAAITAAQQAARRVGKAIHRGQLCEEDAEKLKAQVENLHQQISTVSLDQQPSHIARELTRIARQLERICT